MRKAPYIGACPMSLQEAMSGWRIKNDGAIKWMDCLFCKHQIVGTLDFDFMPDITSHRVICKGEKR